MMDFSIMVAFLQSSPEFAFLANYLATKGLDAFKNYIKTKPEESVERQFFETLHIALCETSETYGLEKDPYAIAETFFVSLKDILRDIRKNELRDVFINAIGAKDLHIDDEILQYWIERVDVAISHPDRQWLYNYIERKYRREQNETDALVKDGESPGIRLSVDPATMRARRIEMIKNHSYYHNDIIDKSILPPLDRDCGLGNGETITLSDYMKRLRKTTIRATQILGEGGMGKSSSLLALWDELDHDAAEIPLLVPLHEANLCKRERLDVFLLRYLCENYFFPNSDVAVASQNARLKTELSKNTGSPEYILLLDGFNEVSIPYKFDIAKQIKDFLSYNNLRIIIASRQDLDEYLGMGDLNRIALRPLRENKINAYIRSCNQNPDDANSFKDLLKTPMMLTVYCETTKIVSITKELDFFRYLNFDMNVNKKGELISNYMESLAAKRYLDASKKNKEPLIALAQELWMNHFILPKIAWDMVKRQAFQWEKPEPLLDVLSKVEITGAETRNWFRDRRLLNVWIDVQEALSPSDRQDVMPENILSYLESWPTVFVKRKYWEFVHQDYRDFCAARYVHHQWENGDEWNESIPDEVLSMIGAIYDAYK